MTRLLPLALLASACLLAPAQAAPAPQSERAYERANERASFKRDDDRLDFRRLDLNRDGRLSQWEIDSYRRSSHDRRTIDDHRNQRRERGAVGPCHNPSDSRYRARTWAEVDLNDDGRVSATERAIAREHARRARAGEIDMRCHPKAHHPGKAGGHKHNDRR